MLYSFTIQKAAQQHSIFLSIREKIELFMETLQLTNYNKVEELLVDTFMLKGEILNGTN